MSAGGLYAIGISALNAYQNAMSVTGNNIANVYTPGYTRSTIGFAELPGKMTGGGVQVVGTQRHYNDFLNSEIQVNQSHYSQYAAYYEHAAKLDSFLSNDASSINSALQGFFDTLQSALSDPQSLPSRRNFLNQAHNLVDRFKLIDDKFNSEQNNINQELISITDEINTLSSEIASINDLMTHSPENADILMDQRNLLLQQLSEYIPFNAVTEGEVVNVYVGSGDALVVSGRAAELTVVTDPQNPTHHEIAMKSDNYNAIISNNIHSGKLGGLLSFRDAVLEPAKQELGRLALVFSDSVNSLHQQGVDLDGEKGDLFFSPINDAALINARISSKINNTGSGNMSLTINDASQLVATDYQMNFTQANTYIISRISDGAVVNSGALTTFPVTINFDGLSLEVNPGTYNAGDQYRLAPTQNAVRNMAVNLTDTSKIAFASIIMVENDTANFGSGMIHFDEVTDITNASFATPNSLSPAIKIEFLSENSYQLLDANSLTVIEGPVGFTPGTPNPIFPTPGGFDPGYRVSLSGHPKTNDIFTMNYNANGAGDNSNGRLLTHLQTATLVENKLSLQSAYGQFSNNVATKTHFASIAEESSKSLLQKSEANRDAFSGVNLDEEATNLLAYQKAYQMSAQLIGIADSLFQTLLDLL